MKKQEPTWFTFEKVEDKYHSKINPDFLFYMQTTHGIPLELVVEKINNLSIKDRLALKLASWQKFAKENDVDLDEIRKANETKKEQMMSVLEEIYG